MRKRVAGKRAVALVMASLMMTSMVGCGGKGAAGGSSTKVMMTEPSILPNMK